MNLRKLVLGEVVTENLRDSDYANARTVWWRRPGERVEVPGYDADNPILMRVRFLFGIPPGLKLAFYKHESTDPLDMHCHGGRVLSFIIRGGYIEEKVDRFHPEPFKVYRRPLSFNWMDTDTFHAIRQLCGRKVLTFVIVFPNVQRIGFYVDGKYVSMGKYMGGALHLRKKAAA